MIYSQNKYLDRLTDKFKIFGWQTVLTMGPLGKKKPFQQQKQNENWSNSLNVMAKHSLKNK